MGTQPLKRPPPREKPPVTAEQYLHEIYRRVVRIETRQGRIMERMGLDNRGDPIKPI